MIDPKTLNIPKSPGVYLFKGKSGNVIYVGKAKNLADRVKSYFASNLDNPKTASMVSNAESIEFIRTNTELEALLLESSLIKSHYPKYNIDLKDTERYSYLKITDEKYPRLLVSRRNRHGRFSGPPGSVFGPFAQGSPKVLTVGAMRKIFKIRTCRVLPKKPGLQYYLGNCEAPCAFAPAEENYAKHVALLKKTLSSKQGIGESISHFTLQMEKAAHGRDFELAKMYRDSAYALSGLMSRQSVESDSQYNEDYFALRMEGGVCHVYLFNVQHGVVKQRKKFTFDLVGGDYSPLDEFALSYYQAGNVPKFIYSRERVSRPVLEMLSSQAGFKVESLVPQKGDHSKLLEMLEQNLVSDLNGNAEPSIVALQAALGMEKPPNIIECFDISTMQGSQTVGSMSRFVGGRPDKSGYRKFKIKTVTGQDDFASIEEIVYRRYKRLLEEKRQLPDLVLIDGGAGQLASAFNALSRLNLDLECISIAKEFEEIYSAKFTEPLRLPRANPGLKLLQHARDEAHRFGITYHRKLARKELGGTGKKQR
ncbi:MAG TPA: excinuclease ABC subunit UvrC [Candidatus Micrarchaeota archaeon]|nr:excinuclease ABC subunit UvrC [Candidatus Micrarchaeota archaeon]